MRVLTMQRVAVTKALSLAVRSAFGQARDPEPGPGLNADQGRG